MSLRAPRPESSGTPRGAESAASLGVGTFAPPRRRRGLGRRLRGLARRILTLLAVLGMVVAGITMPPPPPAHAGLYNLFPADFDGFPKAHFYSDEALYVTLTSDTKGGFVCIVAASITDPSRANCMNNLAWGDPQQYVGLGTLLGYPLEAPRLQPGKWRLLTVPQLENVESVPVVKNVVLDQMSIKTPAPGTELSEVFEVEACDPCDESWARDELQTWKNTAKKFVPNAASVKVQKAFGAASKAYKVASGMYAGASGGLAGILLGGMAGAGVFTFAVDIPSTDDLAKKVYKELADSVRGMYAGIAADPPDPNFGTVTQPDIHDVDQTANPLLNDYFDAMMRAAAYGDASRIANERYQGAVAAGDHEAAYRQAQAAATFTSELVGQLRLLRTWSGAVATFELDYDGPELTPGEKNLGVQPNFFDDFTDVDDVDTYWSSVLADLDDIAAHGISDEQRADLKDCDPTQAGLSGECPVTDDLIDAAISQAQDPGFMAYLHSIDVHQTIGEFLQSQQGLYDDAIDDFGMFGNWMAHQAAAEYLKTDLSTPNRPPTSSFTTSATAGSAPLTVTFTSQATDPDGDTLALTWDIAGARTVTGQASVTHTFTSPGEYWVSLVATDPDGVWDQAVKKILVYPPAGAENYAPTASFTPQTVDQDGPFDQTFTSTSTDPDGDTLTHTWYFGDGTSYTGETVTKTFPPGYITSVLLVVSDGQLTSQASGEVTSRKPGSDPNQPPVVSFTADPDSGTSPLQVLFTSTSTDPDGDALSNTWYFGDGQVQTGGTVVAHTYAFPGTYTVTLVVSDGTASVSTTRTVTATDAVVPLQAAFTVGSAYDAAAATNGAQMLDTGIAQHSSYPVTNLMLPSSYWRTPNNETGEQTIIIKPAGGGRDLLDHVVLTGANSTASVKTFSVALTRSDNPFGGYTTVLDHETLEQSAAAQTFAFAPQTATFLRLTVHDNRGSGYLRLDRLSAPTAGRDGGLVSLDTGIPATIAAVSTEYSATYAAANVLKPDNSYWSTPSGTVTDQTIRVALGGDGPHMIGSVVLRGSNSAQSAKDFEVWASETGDDGTFTQIGSGALAQSAALQEFPVTPTEANYVELRLLNNHGAGNYLYLYELRVLTTAGLNVADGAGVGAQIVDDSGTYPGYLPANVLTQQTNNGWIGAAGHVTDQYVTVLLRNGDRHVIDRVVITPGNYRPENVEIQVSMDGVTFTTVATQRLLNVVDDQTIAFPSATARYVRAMLKDGYHATYLGVKKLRVIATDRGGAAAVPFTDVSTGSAAPTGWAWDFGDGATSTDRHPVHTFPGPGTYPITLTVTDAGGGTDTVAGSYTVPGLPTLGITTASDTVNEGAAVPVAASANGVPVVQWDWDLDYTKPTATGASVTARFPDDGAYTVRTRGLTADWLWTPWQEQAFTVLNVAPSVNAGADLNAFAQDPITTPVAAISDPGADTLTCTWNWGDGTTEQTIDTCTTAKARIPHTYALPGDYTATLTVRDDDGGETADTVTVTSLIRPTFLQVTQATAVGADLQVTVRLIDSAAGTGVAGDDLQIAAGSGASRTASTDADGFASVTLIGGSATDAVTADFAGTALHQASSLTRPVRAPQADIVFAVDESGSMAGKQAAVIANLQSVAQALGASLDYRIGVVGYASTDTTPQGFGHLHTALSDDVTQFFLGTRNLVATNGSANAYDAIVAGSGYRVENNAADGRLVDTQAMQFRSTAASCMVLVTDAAASEIPAAAPKTTRAHAEQALADRRTTLFSITVTDQATKDAYGPGPGLAGQTGGDWWPVDDFVRDPAGVLDALVTKCVTKAQTPDLSVTIDAPMTVAGSDPMTVTVTATNNAAIDTPAVRLTATLPDGLIFDSASDGGTFDSDTRTVSWTAVDLDAGDHTTRTITAHLDVTGITPGDHPFDLSASVDYNGSLGVESDLDNNHATHTVTVQVPERYDVSIAGGTTVAVEAGDEVSYTLTVTNNGTTSATGVTVLQRVSDRLRVTGVDLPDGWQNLNGGNLVGSHPDGRAAGAWLQLSTDDMTGSVQIVVTAQLLPLDQPGVIDDQGPLDEQLPDLARVLVDELSSSACVSADRDEVAGNNCAEVRVPVKDILAAVTVRLSRGITFLIVSVDTTDALDGLPVTLTWTPGPFAHGTTPDPVVVTALRPGKRYTVAWPGAAFDVDGGVTTWPGWRPVTDADFDTDGNALHPSSGQVMTGDQLSEMFRGNRILDPAQVDFAWRAPSTLTFSVNPSVDVPVRYREVVPAEERPDTGGMTTTTSTSTTTTSSTPTSTTTSSSATTTTPTSSTVTTTETTTVSTETTDSTSARTTENWTATTDPSSPVVLPTSSSDPDRSSGSSVLASQGGDNPAPETRIVEPGHLAGTGPSGLPLLMLLGLALAMFGALLHRRGRARITAGGDRGPLHR